MKVVVGLGNPGKEYEGTRHNMGYMVLDAFADMASVDFDHHDFKGVYAIVKNPSFPEPFILAKPETFMNLSGEFVRPLLDYFKIDPSDLLIVFDDMAIPEGTIRLRPGGSSGGHNGLKSIFANLKTEEIKRIKIGIGEPPHSGVEWVLTKPKGESADKIHEAIELGAKAVRDYLLHGFAYAMNHYNQRRDV